MEKKKDYCTWFFERFPRWNINEVNLCSPWEWWRMEDISGCCKIHDDTCSFHAFIKCLWNKRVVLTTVIAVGGAIGCIVRFPKIVWKRIW